MSRLEHDFSVRRGTPALHCSHAGCTVTWGVGRHKPTGACRGRRPLEWVNVGGSHAVPDCGQCFDFLTQPMVAEAIASVGIETGGVDIWRMLDSYHANGHKER